MAAVMIAVKLLLHCLVLPSFELSGKGRLLGREATPIPDFRFLPVLALALEPFFAWICLGLVHHVMQKSLRICDSS